MVTEEAVMSVQDKSYNSMKRVKVYLLNSDGKWDDHGTGHLTVHQMKVFPWYLTVHQMKGPENHGLYIVHEDDSEALLLHSISSEDIYRKQEDTIIILRDREHSSAIALSFQEYTYCSYIWDQICWAQRIRPFNSLNNDSTAVDEPVEESPEELPVADNGVAMSTASQSSKSQTKKSLPCQEIIVIEDDPLVSDHSHQLLKVNDATHNKGFTVGAEKHNPTINVIDKTCIEETSVGVKKPEKGITFDILSEHFGKSLDDAANSLHVSRSTFKRICRSHGIRRWQRGKSRMGIQSSSNLRKVNDKEPSRMDYVYSGMPHQQDTAVAHTSQNMNKINVKASYNGVAIRFELLDSSGVAELEDNVVERLKMGRDSFSIKYEDDEGDWVLIACDKDVQKCIEISRSLRRTTIKMLVDLPVSHYVS